jgi:F420-dependent oxidoreductase-like protein
MRLARQLDRGKVMKIGLWIPRFTWPAMPIGSRLAEIGEVAEQVGFESIWVMDHFFQIPTVGDVAEPMLEAYTTLGFLARATSRARLGAMVTGVTYRYPGVLIKQVTTLDVLSGGRATFGVGAAWFEREHIGLGIPFPPLKERMERLEETVQLALHMWRGDANPFIGRYYQLREPLCSPAPVSSPHPPILIGGGGEKKTLRLVARYADACNLSARLIPMDQLPHKLDVLRGYCRQLGRDYDEIEKTVLFDMDPGENGTRTQAVLDKLGRFAEMGFQTAIGAVESIHTLRPLEIIGRDVMPQAHTLTTGPIRGSAAA